MRIYARREPPDTPSKRRRATGGEAYIRVRALVETSESGTPTFIIEVRDEGTGTWEKIHLAPGERIDMTIFVP